jgi:hypothetical protein
MAESGLDAVFYVVSGEDNVGTALADIPEGTAKLRGGQQGTIMVKHPIPFGHKIALRPIEEGGEIIKYKYPIALASAPIGIGEYVHIHNAKSGLDTRSNSFDEEAKPRDIEYKLY